MILGVSGRFLCLQRLQPKRRRNGVKEFDAGFEPFPAARRNCTFGAGVLCSVEQSVKRLLSLSQIDPVADVDAEYKRLLRDSSSPRLLLDANARIPSCHADLEESASCSL